MDVRCAQCGRGLNSGDRFCIACGAPVTARPAPARVAASADRPTGGGAAGLTMPAPIPAADPAAGPAAAASSRYDPARIRSGAPEIALLPGERPLYEANFAPRLLAPHLLTHLTVTDKRVIVRHPHTLFGFIPLGYLVSSAPHSSVEQVDSGMHVRSSKVIWGCSAILLACYSVWQVQPYYSYGIMRVVYAVFALVALIVGLGQLMTARRVGIMVYTGGSQLFAMARGNQISDVQASAQTVTALVLEGEPSRGLG